ncbi:MAG: response regulator transcription factor [Sphingobacteriales bacterium]|nr:MAG: response regulator transcription factor [Sphingobacteriales bacterium]
MDYKVVIVDDEFQSRKLIGSLLSANFAGLQIVGEAENLQNAIKLISDLRPSLIFLDVQLGAENGFDLLDHEFGFHPDVIFITAHQEFAVKAFRYNAMDYLMKPLDRDEFRAAVKKAIDKTGASQANAGERLETLKENLKLPDKIPDRIVIPTSEGYLIVPFQEILYCQSNGNYTEFQLQNKKKIISSHTMGYYEEILSEHNFFRVHRSYIVNLAFVKMYKKRDGGTLVVSDGMEIEVSRSYKEVFLKLFK